MISARRSPAFAALFARDAAARLARAFDAVRAAGVEGLRVALAEGPLLVVTNHTSWWDPLVAIYLSERVLGAEGHGMMDARNLARLPFFARVGAFGVDLESPSDGARAIRHAAKLLHGPRRLVWIFPQGREVPLTSRPLSFRAGSGHVARLARDARVAVGALRYEMGATPRPTLWVSFAAPTPPGDHGSRGTEAQREAVEAQLERIDRAIVSGADGDFVTLLRARPARALALAQAALAWMTRPRLAR